MIFAMTGNHLIPTTIEFGPQSGSTRVCERSRLTSPWRGDFEPESTKRGLRPSGGPRRNRLAGRGIASNLEVAG